jgi:membrane-associated protease RseP (regulator of RpoE activity)
MDTWPSFPLSNDRAELKRIVQLYFTIYEEPLDATNVFFIEVPDDTDILNNYFEQLRLDLKEIGYIPFLRKKGGEYLLHLTKKPIIKTRPEWLNWLLFAATVITTMLSGSVLFLEKWSVEAMLKPTNMLDGLVYFSVPIMLILGIHELGHYFISKKHNVSASLPFFIPIPPNPVLPLGTLGAVISMREPIPNRQALIEIGIAGPIAGFLTSIPICLIGLFLMQENPVLADPIAEDLLTIQFPLLLQAMSQFFNISENAIIHPTAFAGWVGLLVTAINLLPAGQLDGGHIARGTLLEKHKYASTGAIALLIISALFGGPWIFFAFFIVFIIGVGHPPALNEHIPLDRRLKILAILAVIIFLLSFTPIPISG